MSEPALQHIKHVTLKIQLRGYEKLLFSHADDAGHHKHRLGNNLQTSHKTEQTERLRVLKAKDRR